MKKAAVRWARSGRVDPKEFASAVKTALRNEKGDCRLVQVRAPRFGGQEQPHRGGGVTAGCRGFFQSRGGDAESQISHHFAPLLSRGLKQKRKRILHSSRLVLELSSPPPRDPSLASQWVAAGDHRPWPRLSSGAMESTPSRCCSCYYCCCSRCG